VRRPLGLALLISLGSTGSARALVWPDVPERVERALSSQDPASRRVAARDLATLGPARAQPLVLAALGDPDVEVRLAAAQSAIRLRIPAATDAALQWLGERDVRLRTAACDVAHALPSPRAVPALARALGDSDAQVRASCADALGAQGSPDAVAPLSGKLDDPTPNVRVEVARALARLGDRRAVVPLVGKVQDSVTEVRQAVVRALGDLGDPRATQALLLALRDNAPEVKMEALAALGRLRAPEAAAPIAPLALERNAAVRKAALVALGRTATPDAVRALVRALGVHEDATGTLERTPVRDALVSAGAPAVTELTAMLERPLSAPVATSAAWVLGELGASGSAAAIVSALRKGTLPAAAAMRALAGAGTPAVVPVVLEFVSDPSPVVRAEALATATVLLDPARPDGRAVEPLAAMLRDPRTSPDERAAIATLLGRTGAPRAAAVLAALVSSNDPGLRLAAIDALGALESSSDQVDDALVPLLSDTDPAVRLRSAVALAASGGTRARRALLTKLEGEEIDRYAVFAALGGLLGRLPDAAASARLFRELELAAGPERDAIVEAAGRARLPEVVRALGDVARSADPDDRRAVAAVLAAHRGSAEARGIARALARDADLTVRARAAYTLGALGDLSTLRELSALVRTGDVAVATNAAAAVASVARAAGPGATTAVASAMCPALADGRPTVRANVLSALAAAGARCGDGGAERQRLTGDPSDLVRASAARAITAAQTPSDAQALDRCVSSDRSAEVAHLCRPASARSPRAASAGASGGAGARPRAVTVYVFAETGNAPRPRAPFLLQYENGVLRAGVADRRGATFDPVAPSGDLVLRRAQRHSGL
jgi:cellulose synthase operon protein C